MKTFLKILDVTRIVLVSFAVYYGYYIGFEDVYDPVSQLHVMIPMIILAIAGISGLEGLLFSKVSAELKGFETGSNYQKQSAIALLSYVVVAVLVYFCDWGIKAELTIFFTFIFFFTFSGLNHAIDAIRRKNYKWQNINRPIITLLLIAATIYPIVKALQIN